MIARLTGRIVEREPGRVVLEVGEIGYELQVSLQTFAALPADGPVTLCVHTHMRDSSIQLFGFFTRRERAMFERLQTVAGVGPRLAIGILSGRSPGEIAGLIRSRDVEGLKRLPGVGKRTAERLVADLCEKVDDICPPTGAVSSAAGSRLAAAGDGGDPGPDLRRDARMALLNLGYREPAVDQALDRLLVQAPAAVPRLEDLLRDALRVLARR